MQFVCSSVTLERCVETTEYNNTKLLEWKCHESRLGPKYPSTFKIQRMPVGHCTCSMSTQMSQSSEFRHCFGVTQNTTFSSARLISKYRPLVGLGIYHSRRNFEPSRAAEFRLSAEIDHVLKIHFKTNTFR